jgi:hypothetical protein
MAEVLQDLQSIASKPFFCGIALTITLALMIFLTIHREDLKTDDAPSRIVSLELAWSKATAEKVINSWTPQQRQTAVSQVLIDFIFIAAYACLLLYMGMASATWAQTHRLAAIAPLAIAAGLGGFAAGILDCLENLGLLAMLWSKPTGVLAFLTSLFATLKFVLGTNAIFVSGNVFFATVISILQQRSAWRQIEPPRNCRQFHAALTRRKPFQTAVAAPETSTRT